MVASAPSPTAEWLPTRRLLASRRRHQRRRVDLGGSTALLVGDLAVGLAAALVIHPITPVADLALVAGWGGLLAPVRRQARGPASIGSRPCQAVLRAACVLALVSLLLATVAGATASASLAAFVTAVATAGLLHRGLARRLDRAADGRTVPVVVAGHRHGVIRMLAELGATDGPFTVVAACLSGPPDPIAVDVPVVSGLRNLSAAVAEHGAEAVVVVPCRHLDAARVRRIAWRLERAGTALFVSTGLRELDSARAQVRVAGSLPLVHVRHAALRGTGQVAKRTWERVAAALALAALGPLLLLLALVVRMDSPGPALFRQTRVGRDGRTFTMLKLRTMCVDAERRLAGLTAARTDDGVLFKLAEDPRVTRVGRFLRRYSLDELPQLINVVRGDMALVGPRPPLPSEVAQYDGDTQRRLVVVPGLTGLWQVSGRSDLDWDESVRLDLWYVENWSLGLDLTILLRTVGAVLGHRGAY